MPEVLRSARFSSLARYDTRFDLVDPIKKDLIDVYKILLIHYHRKFLVVARKKPNIRDCLDKKIGNLVTFIFLLGWFVPTTCALYPPKDGQIAQLNR